MTLKHGAANVIGHRQTEPGVPACIEASELAFRDLALVGRREPQPTQREPHAKSDDPHERTPWRCWVLQALGCEHAAHGCDAFVDVSGNEQLLRSAALKVKDVGGRRASRSFEVRASCLRAATYLRELVCHPRADYPELIHMRRISSGTSSSATEEASRVLEREGTAGCLRGARRVAGGLCCVARKPVVNSECLCVPDAPTPRLPAPAIDGPTPRGSSSFDATACRTRS